MTDSNSRRVLADDQCEPMHAHRPPRRVVSLLPPVPEALAVPTPERLVGATDWWTYPADLHVVRVRRTHGLGRQPIKAHAPDLVIANEEENGWLDVDRSCPRDVPGWWATVIELVNRPQRTMQPRFVHVLDVEARQRLRKAADGWSGPAPQPDLRLVVLIWRSPWTSSGPATPPETCSPALAQVNALREFDPRYSHSALEQLQTMDADVVSLPDKPYAFTSGDVPEAARSIRTVLASARERARYARSLLAARTRLLQQIREK